MMDEEQHLAALLSLSNSEICIHNPTQEASSHGIHITFQCLNPSPSQPRELHEAVGLAAFVSAVSPYENASYFEHQPGKCDRAFVCLIVARCK